MYLNGEEYERLYMAHVGYEVVDGDKGHGIEFT
jgi:hypothetical protein